MSEREKIVDLRSRRAPVCYTVNITHHWDDSFEVFVEGVSDDARAQESVNHAIARIAENRMNERHIHGAMLARIDALMGADSEPETSELMRLAEICERYEELLYPPANDAPCSPPRSPDMSEPFGKDVGREVLPPYKEPGQIAHEAYYAYSPEPWADVPEHLREAWVRVEAAIYEDAAKCAEEHSWARDIDWWLHATKKEVSVVAAEECAKAIRAKIGKSNG